jgi:hypothetical protein
MVIYRGDNVIPYRKIYSNIVNLAEVQMLSPILVDCYTFFVLHSITLHLHHTNSTTDFVYSYF